MDRRTVFVIFSIGSPGSEEHRRHWLTLKYLVRQAFSGKKWEVIRADEEASPDSITTQVIGRIIEADVIVANPTDHNPNVFYELTVAHGFGKPVVHMMQEGQKAPFDVVDQRVIFYDLGDPESVDKARGALVAAVNWLDDNPGQARNPLSAYGQFKAISSGSGSDMAGGGSGQGSSVLVQPGVSDGAADPRWKNCDSGAIVRAFGRRRAS